MQTGQNVICRNNSGYQYSLTEGKTYKVEKYEPQYYNPTFTWPAYVTVIGDNGKFVMAHAHRFVTFKE